MSPVNPERLEKGEMVQHTKDGYIGRYDDVTKLKKELPSDDVGIRVVVVPSPEAREEIRIASATLLRTLSELSLEDRHKAHLEFLGIPYKGIRECNKLQEKQRKTFCWNCKKDLDNNRNPECVACGWILCHCGTCGCGWTRK